VVHHTRIRKAHTLDPLVDRVGAGVQLPVDELDPTAFPDPLIGSLAGKKAAPMIGITHTPVDGTTPHRQRRPQNRNAAPQSQQHRTEHDHQRSAPTRAGAATRVRAKS